MFTLLKNLLFLPVFFCILLLSASESSSHIIKVRVSGQGCSRSEALEDAFRQAVREVVGVYIISQSSLNEEDFKQSIYVNSDAVITEHKEISSKEENGIVTLVIEASVVKNHLAKYIVKKTTSSISATDRSNILNRRRTLLTALCSVEFIFKEHQIFKARKIGAVKTAEGDDPENHIIKLKMDYELFFNETDYRKLEKRFKALLKKIAIAEYETQSWPDAFLKPHSGALAAFNRRGSSENWPRGSKTIVFRNQPDSAMGETFHCFVIPNQLYQKTAAVLDSFSLIIWQLKIAGRAAPVMFQRRADLSFYDFCSAREYHRDTIIFNDLMYMKVNNSRPRFQRRREILDFELTNEEFRKLRSCTIRILTGKQAKYVCFAFAEPNERELINLSDSGYVPAMLILAKKFNRRRYLHNAALMGNQEAVKKLKWKNLGMGIYLNNLRVHSATPGIAVSPGMLITEFNGIKVRSVEHLSGMLGRKLPDQDILVKFDGKHNVIVRIR